MMFEAIIFLAGAVLFFLSVIFFLILWQDRVVLARRKETLRDEVATLKEQRIDLEIREHELIVWAEGLEHQQKALEQAERELHMLTASKQAGTQDAEERPFVVDTVGTIHHATEEDEQARADDVYRGDKQHRAVKNLKQNAKLST
jgi:uncharacterized protein (DUF3084 family)